MGNEVLSKDFSDLVGTKEKEAPLGNIEQVKRAQEDFRYVCSKTYIYVSNNVDLLAISKNGTKFGDCLVVPFDVAKKEVRIPSKLVDLENSKMFVAIVCYQEEKPVEVLMLKTELFKKPANFFDKVKSCFKFLTPKLIWFNKETSEYIVKINDLKHDSVQKYAFGLVMSQLT